MVELLIAGVPPCVPQHTLELPGGVPLVGAFIPPGSFLMGGTVWNHEKPIHRVIMKNGFFIGVSAVTQAQWKAVVGTDPSEFKGPNKPVEMVSWDNCQEFCAKLTAHLKGSAKVRLPTETEWEYACRAGTTTEFHFGDRINAHLANYDGTESWNGSPVGEYREETTDVGLFPPNPWGLFELHGNVYEWCADLFAPYEGADRTHTDDDGDWSQYRVQRGGAWYAFPQTCRAATRGRSTHALTDDGFGFRVCFSLD